MGALDQWGYDFRHAWRQLLANRGVTTAAALSLAIGIGATSALFSVTNALLLTPLPYKDADQIAIIWQRSPGLGVPQDWLSVGQYLDIKAGNKSFAELTAAIGASYNLTGTDRPERVDGVRVTSSFFSVFGIAPRLGRAFSAAEDTPGQALTVILTDGFWHRRFGGDPAILGKTLTLNGNQFTIVGVMAPSFTFDKEVMPAVNGIERANFLLPIPLPPTARAKRDGEDFNLFARLKDGVSVKAAQADMDLIATQMKAQYPANYPADGGLTLSVVPLLTQVVGDVRLALYVLLGAVACVLLIACGNVANLMLSRAAVREKEIAIRVALGAGHWRVVRQLMSESLLLAVLGGVSGLLLAWGAVALIHQAGPATLPRLQEIGVDGRVVLFTTAVSLLTSLAFGLVPALTASQVDPNGVLKEGGRGSTTSRALGLGHPQLRRLLITGEVALSLVLLLGAGLLIRSYLRITDASPGFDPTNVLTFRVTLPGNRYNTPELVTNFFRDLESRLGQIGGVRAVGANYLLPLSSVSLGWEPIEVEGYTPKSSGESLIISSSGYISPDYYKAMGIPLVSGRFFDDHDTKDSPPVVIVDQAFAQRFWPGQDPLGKRMRQAQTEAWRTVVGVVNDNKEYRASGEPPITAYYSMGQIPVPSRFMVMRTTVDPQSVAAPAFAALRAIDPDLPAYDVATMASRLSDSLARRRFAAVLLGLFAAVAATLAAIGVYGVITYWTTQRTREIGIRMALGARPQIIEKMVVTQAVTPVAIGLLVGLIAAFALSRVVESLLFGIGATDPTTFVILPIVLALVALAASWLPARRASRVDPLVAVRQE